MEKIKNPKIYFDNSEEIKIKNLIKTRGIGKSILQGFNLVRNVKIPPTTNAFSEN